MGSEPHRATSEVLACVRADASSSLLLGSNSCGRPEGRVERVSSKNHFCQFTNESYIHTMNRATAARPRRKSSLNAEGPAAETLEAQSDKWRSAELH